MARRDLTALAALGTLGYLLSKKGDKEKEVTKTNVYDVEDARKVEAAPEEDPMEVANRRVERTLVNPNAKEFGDPGTSETVTPTKKPVVKPTVKQPNAQAMARSLARANANATGEGSYVPQRDTSVDRRGKFDMSNYRPRRNPGPNTDGRGEVDMSNYRPRRVYENAELSDMTYKKGGKVKKMASGGMTSKPSSASKRADGIASRGKTKCKMY